MKMTFDERADLLSLSLADRVLAELEGIVEKKSGPREETTVPNYFVSLESSPSVRILNLCLWDNGVVALEFRHPDYLPPDIRQYSDVKLYGSMQWPQYRFRDTASEFKNAVEFARSYIEYVRPGVEDGTIKERGTSKSERLLRKKLKEVFPEYTIRYNYRGYDWLKKLELDIEIPAMSIAVEVQGGQHFKPIWGEENLKRLQENDETKKKACLANGVSLIRITTEKALRIEASDLRELIERAHVDDAVAIDYY